MLIHRIYASMDKVMEGVDLCSPSLILEATAEFEKSAQDLKSKIEEFTNVCASFSEIEQFTSVLKSYSKDLAEVDFDKISDDYSFSDHYELFNEKPKDGEYLPPSNRVANAAINFPICVSALRDAILEIAKWCEGYPKIFSVGKNGISFTQEFSGFVKNENLQIKDFCEERGEQILMKVVGAESEDIDALKSEFEKAWKTEGLAKEKEDDAWNAFVAEFKDLGQKGRTSHDTATEAIKNAKAPNEIKDEAADAGGILKGLLGGLFGGKAKKEVESMPQHPEYIIGQSLTDDYGLYSMSFLDLQKLIVKVIEYSGIADTAGAKALAGIETQNKESMQPSKGATKVIKQIKKVSSKLGQEDIAGIGTELEQAGMKDSNLKTVDKKKFRNGLLDMYDENEDNSEKTDAVIQTVLDDGDNEESDSNVIDVIKSIKSENESWQDDTIEMLQDENIIDSDGKMSSDIDIEDVKIYVDEMADDGQISDEDKKKLKAVLKLEESRRLFRRWGKLAGIILE